MVSYATLNDFALFISSYATGTNATVNQKVADDNTVITDLLEETSRVIDDITGEKFYTLTGTYYYDCPEDSNLILLDRSFISVTSVTNGDGVLLTGSSYNVLPLNDSPKYGIQLKNGNSWSVDSNGNTTGVITVIGVEGYSISVPVQIKLACLFLTLSFYRQRRGEAPIEGGFVTQLGTRIFPAGIPKTVIQLLTRFMRDGVA